MIFVFLFVAGALVVPVMLDSKKNPGNNIFRRSGRDLLQYEFVNAILRFFRVSADRISTAFVGAFGVASIVVILFVVAKLFAVGKFLVKLFR